MGWIADLLKEIPSAARYKSELEAMEKKVISLEAENKELQLENVNLRQEIQRRDNVIQKQEPARFETLKENILRLLAEHPYITAQQIAQELSIHTQVAEFHLKDLENTGFAGGSYSGVDDTEWFISHNGRSYLIQHALLS